MERYESLGVVGEGSYGVVLRCRHKETGQTVAIKKFLESEDDHTVKKIALREVRMLKKLRHENLVNLIEFFRRKRRLYLVFEYVDHTILDELEATETGLDEDTARAHIFQVLRGIAFCHQNQIIHRDVKPENVLVSRLGVVKLCDFGFARLLAGPGESCTDYVATRWYRAPELLVGDTKYGREVDVWASGCLLSEMLTGEPLFPGESDIDQLFHIIQTLGELSMTHRHLVDKNPMLAGLRLPAAASTPLASSFPSWSPRAHTFVSACLCLEPTSRPSAQDLLNHEFFSHDCFPDTFLPLLRQRVQQEFSGNSLLGNGGRRGSSTNDKRSRSRRAPGGVSPESVYGKSIARPPPPPTTRTDTLQPTRTSPMKQPTQTSQSQGQPSSRPVVTFAPLTPTHSRTPAAAAPPGIPSSTTIINNNNSNITTTTTADHHNTPTTTANTTSQSVLIPPLRDYYLHASQSSSCYTTNNNNNNNHPIALTLHITGTTTTSSPARSRGLEKHRKSPVTPWGASTKSRSQGLCIQGQGPGQGLWEDEDHQHQHHHHQHHHLLTTDAPPPSSLMSGGGVGRHGDFSRHFDLSSEHTRPADVTRHLDLSRNPYTISLDRTKELVARDPHRDTAFSRDSGRDPLREIKDNPRDWDPLGHRELRESVRRPKLEVMGWAKPRLLNDDLSLPNVPGVSGGVNSTSPKKSMGEALSGGRKRREGGGVVMPVLSSAQRGSATSVSPGQG